MMAIRSAVIGAGAMGSVLDPGIVPTPLTHAGGMVLAGCDLCALVDPSDHVIEEAKKWNTQAFTDFSLMMHKHQPQLLSFAVGTEFRPSLMMAALDHDCVKAVIAEKPLAPSYQEAQSVMDAYAAKGIPLIINYSRRFVPIWQKLAGITAMSTVIKYAKGIKHNGTHAIDLCRMLFGECLNATALSGKTDFWPNDPTVTAHLAFERCPDVVFQGLDERCFTLFEVDIIGKDFRVIVDQDGRRVRRFTHQTHAGIPPGLRLVEQPPEQSFGELAMKNLIMHALDVIQGQPVLCSGQDAVIATAIADQLSAQATGFLE